MDDKTKRFTCNLTVIPLYVNPCIASLNHNYSRSLFR
jgi:hypothetical protein